MTRKNRSKEESSTDESWLLPYADMLTLLLALFIVLFAMSEVDVKKFEKLASIFQTEFSSSAGIMDEAVSIVPEKTSTNEITKDEEEETEKGQTTDSILEFEMLQSIRQNMEEYILSNDLTNTLETDLTSEGLLITIRTDITFDSGSAKVKQKGVEIAKEIATFLNTDPPHEIAVNGHADDRPMYNEEFSSNWELSAMRAIQFMYLLLNETDIEPKWFSARGYGEHRPIVPNTTEENRALNRRVEVLIQPNHNIEEELSEK